MVTCILTMANRLVRTTNKEYIMNDIKLAAYSIIANALSYGQDKWKKVESYKLNANTLKSINIDESSKLELLRNELRSLGWTLVEIGLSSYAVISINRLKRLTTLSLKRVKDQDEDFLKSTVNKYIEKEKLYDSFKTVLRRLNIHKEITNQGYYFLTECSAIISDIKIVDEKYVMTFVKHGMEKICECPISEIDVHFNEMLQTVKDM